MITKILIAYEYTDEALVTRIEEKLRQSGFYNIRKDKIYIQNQLANTNLEEADIILLAISPNFLSSAYCHSVEMKRAIERHQQRKASVIPIILQTLSFVEPLFASLPTVPSNHVPISLQKDQESALQEIVSAIRYIRSQPQWPTGLSGVPSLASLQPASTQQSQPFGIPKTSQIASTTPPTQSLTSASQATSTIPAPATQSPLAASKLSVFSQLGNFLLSHQILIIILTIVLSMLIGVFLGLWSNPFVLHLFALSDLQWSNWLQFFTIMISILLTILGFRVIKSKRLSYEVVSDVGLLNEQKDKGEDDIRLIVNGWEENHARMMIVKLANTGDEPVKKADYEKEPIRFDFGPQSLIRCSIHDIVPENKMPTERLKDFIRLDEQNRAFVDVTELPLNPRESINLKIVTRDKIDMRVYGSLAGGKITSVKTAQRKAILRTILKSLIIFLLVGLAIPNGFSLISGSPLNRCVWGNISIDSSTAFNGTMKGLVENYQKSCLLAHLTLNSKASANGLSDLEKSIQLNNNVQLTTSEITPQEAGPPYNAYKDLQEQKLAAIAFSLVISKYVTGVSSLSRDQISKIYDGTYKKWGDVGGQPAELPITPIGRSNDSGTYYAFVNFVLNSRVQNKPAVTLDGTPEVLDHVAAINGAIGYVDLDSANSRAKDVTAIEINQQAPSVAQIASDHYPFWAIERFYTKPNPDALTSAFITYVMSNFRTNSSFISLDAIPKDKLSAHQ